MIWRSALFCALVGTIIVQSVYVGLAQEAEEFPYGSLGLIAHSRSEETLETALIFADKTAGILEDNGRIRLVWEETSLLSDDVQPGRLAELSDELGTDQVALLGFHADEGSVNTGFVEVEIVTVHEPAVSVVPVYVERATTFVEDLLKLARLASVTIIQKQSRGTEVGIVLTIKTWPSQSTYTFGGSGPYQTNVEGLSQWVGTKPEGDHDFAVFKEPDFMRHTEIISVIPTEPYFSYVVRVELKRR